MTKLRIPMSNSRPCSRCLDLIKRYGIKRVYYSYEKELVCEKPVQMETTHVSSKYAKPWSEWNNHSKVNTKGKK